MTAQRIASLRVELASMQETGNPRAAQVRAALVAAGALEAEPETKPRGRPRKETTRDVTPKERA